jgi:L-2,4-diaminobutyrate decarboxylase
VGIDISDIPLLNDRTVDGYRAAVSAGVERIAERFTKVDRPCTGIEPAELAESIATVDLDRPVDDVETALDELGRLYLEDAVYFHHPRYLAHLNCPVAIPALLGEAILAPVNSSLDTWDQSAGGTLIERRLVAWTASHLGLGEQADGVFTSGGSQSNLQALLIARDETCARLVSNGRRQSRPALLHQLCLLTSEVSHFSVAKSATLLGLDPEAVIAVPCDADKRMRPDALRAELDRCQRAGLVPMAVVATAGTTDFGSIDPLADLAAICADRSIWLHVDAAYGCGLLVSRGRRRMLAGIERADSVTVDYHKSFFQPVSSSAVLVRDANTLRHVTYYADYLNPARAADRGIPNQVDKSLQTTRRFDALKLWLTLRVLGAAGLGELFDAVIDRVGEVWSLLRHDSRFEVIVRPQLSTLVFRYLPEGDPTPEECDRINLRIREALFAAGEAVIASTTVDDRHYLKLTLLNPETSLEDVVEVLELIADRGALFTRTPVDPKEPA